MSGSGDGTLPDISLGGLTTEITPGNEFAHGASRGLRAKSYIVVRTPRGPQTTPGHQNVRGRGTLRTFRTLGVGPAAKGYAILIDLLTRLWPYLLSAAYLLTAAVASAHVVLYKRDVRAAIGWVGLIWFSPFVGAALYVFFGINRLRRKATRHAEDEPLGESVQPLATPGAAPVAEPGAALCRYSPSVNWTAALENQSDGQVIFSRSISVGCPATPGPEQDDRRIIQQSSPSIPVSPVLCLIFYLK